MVLAERGSPAAWLAAHPHVGGWLVAPVEGAALVATVRSAAAAVVARGRDRAPARRERPPPADRLGALRRARHRDPAADDRAQRAPADPRRLGLALPARGRTRAASGCCASRSPRPARTTPASHLGAVLPLSRTLDLGLRRAQRRGGADRRRLRHPGRRRVPLQPQLRPGQRLPHEVRAGGADARPRGRDRRRDHADQPQAGVRDGAGLAGPHRGGGARLLRAATSGCCSRWPRRPAWRSRTAACSSRSRTSSSSS